MSRFYPIKGRYFILRLSEIKTLNIDYIKTDIVDEVVAEAPAGDDVAPDTTSLEDRGRAG